MFLTKRPRFVLPLWLLLLTVSVTGCHHATYYQSYRYESKEIRDFLNETLEYDRQWREQNEAVRLEREEEDRRWNHFVATSNAASQSGDVERVMERLFGASGGLTNAHDIE